MYTEIIEAIEEYYKNDKDMQLECLKYLSNPMPKKDLNMLQTYFENACEKYDRCPKCFSELTSKTEKEYMGEFWGSPAYEATVKVYCPECDYTRE